MCIQLETNEYRSGFGAHWPFPSGTGRTIQKDLGIAEYTDPLHITTPEIKAARPQGTFLSLRQDLRPNSWRTGLEARSPSA